jgi:hypothetical protein
MILRVNGLSGAMLKTRFDLALQANRERNERHGREFIEP